MIEQNFIKLFEHSFKENWDYPIYTNYYKNQTFKYSEAATQIAKLHLLFENAKVEQGDKIALIGRNTPNWTITYVAVVTYGAVIVPILQDFNPNDVHHIVNHSESTMLFCSDKVWDTLEEEKMDKLIAVFSLNDFRCIHQKDGEYIQKIMNLLTDNFNKLYPQGYKQEHVKYAERDNAELAMISYTSGTTGFSKGVMISGNALAGNITFGIRTHLLEKGDKVLAFLPLAHAYGMAFDFLTATCVGSHTYLLNKIPSPKVLMKAFEEIKPKVIFTVPLIMEKIYRKQLQPALNKMSMRLALSIPLLDDKIYQQINKKLNEAFGNEFREVVIGGAPLNKEVEDFLRKIGFKFTVGYGMTECAPLICYSPHDKFIPYSASKILDIMEIMIDSEDPYNIVGEICVRGENVMSGYYKNVEATKNIFKEDGWMRTGDMGTIDKEGNLFIKGRCKSMILGASGQNIYPEEIEEKLNNLPFVMESLVIEKDGKLFGLVYPDYEAVDASNISHSDLNIIMEENRKQLNNMVANYENISKIILYPNEFDKTPKRSIKRYLYTNLNI
ncbi:MAG: long-chain fatty acid--CoA ligase [Bacteroidia bacterium]|nr:long-chain fatty acid--CoA ligase [Bacteroidia bacterium]